MKKVSGKRNKTDADLEQLAKLEFLGGLWLCGRVPCIPSTVLEAVLIEGAKKFKLGPKAKAGLVVQDDAVLNYEGSSTPEELLENEKFRLTCGVRIQRNRIMRTRPKFDEWSAEFTVTYNENIIDSESIENALIKAGEEVGIGDWRPKFGLFIVEKL